MIQDYETIRGPLTEGRPKRSYFVVKAGPLKKNGTQHIRARRQEEGVGGTLMETEITLNVDPENMGEWEVVRAEVAA